jgi:hypothetical protein
MSEPQNAEKVELRGAWGAWGAFAWFKRASAPMPRP